MHNLYNNQQLVHKRRKLRRNLTESEKRIWIYIRRKQLDGHRFQRQYSVGSYILDFYCPKLRLAIEIDGGQHNSSKGIRYDKKRTTYLNNYNIKVIRFWNNDVLSNTEGVLLKIREEIEKISLPVPPLP